MVSPHGNYFSGWCCLGWYGPPPPSPLMSTWSMGQLHYPSWKRPAEQIFHNEALPCYKLWGSKHWWKRAFPGLPQLLSANHAIFIHFHLCFRPWSSTWVHQWKKKNVLFFSVLGNLHFRKARETKKLVRKESIYRVYLTVVRIRAGRESSLGTKRIRSVKVGPEAAILSWVSRLAWWKRCPLSQHKKEGQDWARCLFWRAALQATGTTSVKALWLLHTRLVRGTTGRPVRLAWSEYGGNRRSRGQEGDRITQSWQGCWKDTRA